MRILVAPASFKGSLSSIQAAGIIAQAAGKILPQAEVETFPLADGGEGTLQVIQKLIGGKKQWLAALDALTRKKKVFWLKKGDKAYLELAQTSGLTLVPSSARNPLYTTTYGVGEMILSAVKAGCQKIYLGVGGSATNDGGIGALTALGVKFFTRSHQILWPGKGEDLERIYQIDASGLPAEVKKAQLIIMTDVRNVLTGRKGAAYIYAPQKGASEEIVRRLDKGLKHYAGVVKKVTGKNILTIAGGGAAGGIAAGLYGFLNVRIVSGIETILEWGSFENKLARSDLVITGEGSLDEQVEYGKALYAVFHLAEKYHLPVIAFAGSISEKGFRLARGRRSFFSIVPGPVSTRLAMAKAKIFLAQTVSQVLKLYCWGKSKRGSRQLY